MPHVEMPAANKCDFCSAADPQWEYPARTFQVHSEPGLTINSIDEWHACGACHRLIKKGDWAGLALHAAKAFGPKFPLPMIIAIHTQFRRNWTGPARRIEKKESKDDTRTGDR
jgi:hypothetical protein